jgi:hypothetical protein
MKTVHRRKIGDQTSFLTKIGSQGSLIPSFGSALFVFYCCSYFSSNQDSFYDEIHNFKRIWEPTLLGEDRDKGKGV